MSLSNIRHFHKHPRPDDYRVDPVAPSRKTDLTQLSTTEHDSTTSSAHDHDRVHPIPNKSATSIKPNLLWDRAYDSFREDQPALVEAYEKVLSCELAATCTTFPVSNIEKNMIERKDTEMRRSQMGQLVDKGLARIEHEANAKQGVGHVVDVALAANNMISTALKEVG